MDPTNIGAELAGLIGSLRAPSNRPEEAKLKLRRLAYLLPLIKNTQNLGLLVRELAKSPNLLTTVEIVLFAVDAVSSARAYKARVSNPTISLSEWSSELVRAAFSVPPLVGLVVTSGLREVPPSVLLANTVCKPDTPRDLMAAAAACLARAQWAFDRQIYTQLPCALILPSALAVLYTPANLTLEEPPVTNDMGSWSRLIGGLLGQVGPAELAHYLDTTGSFVRLAVAQEYTVEKYKPFFFGVIIQLEGLASQILISPVHRLMRYSIAISMLSVIQPLGFVVEAVGAQFDSFQFVLNVSLDILSENPRAAADAVRSLGTHWSFGQPLGPSPAQAGDLVFFLDISEQLIPTLTTQDAEQLVLPIASRFLFLGIHTSVFEAAHSLMLAYLATHKHRAYSKNASALAYFEQLVRLFPAPLSYVQFRTAVSAVLAAVEPQQAESILTRVFMMAKATMPGTPLEGDNQPPTARAALVSTLAHCAAQVSDAPHLERWLHYIGQMIPAPYSELTTAEARWMRKDLSDVITGLGLDVSDVGIRWWFGEAKF